MINYIIGDATEPVKTPAAIIHIVNNLGAWGAGFVVALSKKWKEPEAVYKAFSKVKWGLDLGSTRMARVSKEITVWNMVAQNGLYSRYNTRPVNYIFLAACLSNVSKSINNDFEIIPSIHLPRIGCGLGGGKWEIVEGLIEDAFPNNEVFVYDLE